MAIGANLAGHNRRTLLSLVTSGIGSGGGDLGTFNVDGFSRLTGLVSVTGSTTLRCQFGINSGTYQVSSTLVVNSGGSVFDMVNYGRVANFAFSLANSTVFTLNLFGEPVR